MCPVSRPSVRKDRGAEKRWSFGRDAEAVVDAKRSDQYEDGRDPAAAFTREQPRREIYQQRG